MSKGVPRSVAVNEVALRLELELPNQLFTKPRLVASMRVPESAVSQKEITAIVTDNIEEAIKTSTGLDMVVRIQQEVDEDEKD